MSTHDSPERPRGAPDDTSDSTSHSNDHSTSDSTSGTEIFPATSGTAGAGGGSSALTGEIPSTPSTATLRQSPVGETSSDPAHEGSGTADAASAVPTHRDPTHPDPTHPDPTAGATGAASAPAAASAPVSPAATGRGPLRVPTLALGLILLAIAASVTTARTTDIDVDFGIVVIGLMIGVGLLFLAGSRRAS